MMLNVGCGNFPAPAPWVNVDRYLGGPVQPDIVCSVLELSEFVQRGSVSHLYCGHLLEHLAPEDVEKALRQMAAVLEPSGKLCIVGPDYDRAVADPALDPTQLASIRDGARRWPGDEHLWVATEASTLEYVRKVFPDAKPADLTTIDPIWPCPFRWVTWQTCILA